MLIALCAALTMSELPTAKELRTWGLETVEQIRRELYLPDSKLYAEDIKAGKRSGPSFNWPAGVMLSALNSAARADKKYAPWLREYADACHAAYWNPAGPVPGYDSCPFPKGADRYYDDNAWMVLQLVETSQVLKDKKYRRWAEVSMKYVMSGWDDQLGGGIYWRENKKTSKNTCSNAPSAFAAFQLGDRKHGHDIVAWMMPKLQDPSDGLMWDSAGIGGKVDKTKWTYNTALTIRTLLSDGQKDEAKRVADSSLRHWIDPTTGAMKDDAAFAHLMCEALLDTSRVTGNGKYRQAVLLALKALRERARDASGHYSKRWESQLRKPVDPVRVIDQASAARAFLEAAASFRHSE
jgi:hypothetical protein